MGQKLSGKVFKARPSGEAEPALKIGLRLRELRMLAGLTQVQVAGRLGIGQAALSRLEARDDLHVSTLRSYIEALGATLRIDAAFDSASQFMAHVEEAFDLECTDDDQLVLPILDDDRFRVQRDVILSIKPQYSEQIVQGTKTVELRRRFPTNVPGGTIAYIYSTTPVRALIGLAEIASVVKCPVDKIWKQYSKSACIKKGDFDQYFRGLQAGYVIQFQNARPLRRSLDLKELRERFDFEPPQSFVYARPFLREALKYECSQVPD